MSIKAKLIRVKGVTTLKVQKNSPHIFFGVGVIGIVTSTVLACRATIKLERTLDAIKSDLEGADHLRGDNYRKDVAYSYAKGTLELGKLYGPAVVIGGVSLLALTGSHVQMTRRNTALTIAYTGLHQAYNEYRARVREHLGEEKERDLYHGVKLEKRTDDKGKPKDIKVVDPNGLSVYSKIFDEGNANWLKDPELNRLFVQCQQNYANDLLQARGHVFLNDAYDMLGFERTQAGQVVGWVIGGDGDNYVDFGLFNCESARFINNTERSIILDFNVDGVVFDKI